MDIEFEIKDILKRLHTIENILLGLTDVIDLARNFEERLNKLEFHQPNVRKLKMENKQQATEAMVKQALIEKAFNIYRTLIDFMNKVPLNPAYAANLQPAFIDINHGMLWFKETINNCPLEFKSPETTPIETQKESQSETENASDMQKTENPELSQNSPE